MKLTRPERWILSNQYRILAALLPEEADGLDRIREAIENGYEFHYDWYAAHIYDGDDVMTAEESEEVIAILDAFSAIKRSYESLDDKSDIEEWRTQFRGFDGNTETKQMAYARYFCSFDGGRFPDLDSGHEFNSHGPTLASYRRILREWKNSRDPNNLTREDLVRITTEWTDPTRR